MPEKAKQFKYIKYVEWGPIGFYFMSLGVLNPKNGKDNFAHPHKVSVCKWAKNAQKWVQKLKKLKFFLQKSQFYIFIYIICVKRGGNL